MLFLDEPAAAAAGATDNTLNYARQYTLWVIVAGAFLLSEHGHGPPCCSEGYAKYASFGLGGGGLLNILLDPLFMFVIMPPGDEVLGAAVATMLSNCASLLLFFLAVFHRLRKKTVLCLSPRMALPSRRSVLSVFSVGLPSATGTLLACLSNTVINKLTSGYNDFALAAMGIVKKLDMLPMNVGMGLCQAMVPLVAYNYAARHYKRMHAFANAARLAGIIFALGCIAVFESFAPAIIALFIGDAETIRYGTDFLRIAVLATPFMICNFQMSYTFQAMGKGAKSLLLTSCRQGLVNIPLLFIMNGIFGLYGNVTCS